MSISDKFDREILTTPSGASDVKVKAILSNRTDQPPTINRNRKTAGTNYLSLSLSPPPSTVMQTPTKRTINGGYHASSSSSIPPHPSGTSAEEGNERRQPKKAWTLLPPKQKNKYAKYAEYNAKK